MAGPIAGDKDMVHPFSENVKSHIAKGASLSHPDQDPG